MKKPVRVAFGVLVALALAYPASAWFLGRQVEARFTEQYEKLEREGVYSVRDRQYQRGVFGATETVTLALAPAIKEILLSGVAMPAGLSAETLAQFQFRVRSDIRHGPFPAGLLPAAASMHSELYLSGELEAASRALFGDKAPLQASARIGFTGSADATLESPAFETRIQTEKGETLAVAWGGIAGQTRVDAGMNTYALQLEMPRLAVSGASGQALQFNGMRLSGEGTRVLPGAESSVFSGWTQLDLASASLSVGSEPAMFELQQTRYRVDTPATGDFIDLNASFAAELLRIAGQDYGPAHYDYAMRHVHVASLDSLVRSFKAAQADPQMQANPLAMLSSLSEPLQAILLNQPEIHVDRLQFRTPEGEAKASAVLKLIGFSAADFANPMMLIGKLDLQAELALPQALALKLMAGKAAPADEDPELAQMRAAMLNQQLEAFLAQGFIEREQMQLKTRLSFRQGQLTLNGKQIGPM